MTTYARVHIETVNSEISFILSRVGRVEGTKTRQEKKQARTLKMMVASSLASNAMHLLP